RARAARGHPPGALAPEGFNARTRVHEYGGGSYLVTDEALVFSNFADQRLYRLDPGPGGPGAVTPAPPGPPRPRAAAARPPAVNAPGRAGSTTSWSRCRPTGAARRWCWPPAATSTPPPGSAPTGAAWPGGSGTTPTCPGTAPSCSWPHSP